VASLTSPLTPRVALATYERAPHLAPDDRPLIPALATLGIRAEPVVWSDRNAPWASFGAVIVRSCWDYHLQHAGFLEWLDALDTLGVPVWNPARLIRWNATKRYLLDLSSRGVATIPTTVIPRGGGGAVPSLAAAEGWTRIVLKPAISASGYETYALATPFDADSRACVERVTALGDALIQPFAPEVPRDGELSLVFIDGAFSHAALKRVRAGDFRVQSKYGGSVEPTTVSDALVSQAAQAVRAVPVTPLYARVDGIVRGEAFLLMELELIEPNLFLGLQSGAHGALARAIATRLV
jgi:glutathione synthase/RimK-type ligase-like ATP-grasp enzyme